MIMRKEHLGQIDEIKKDTIAGKDPHLEDIRTLMNEIWYLKMKLYEARDIIESFIQGDEEMDHPAESFLKSVEDE